MLVYQRVNPQGFSSWIPKGAELPNDLKSRVRSWGKIGAFEGSASIRVAQVTGSRTANKQGAGFESNIWWFHVISYVYFHSDPPIKIGKFQRFVRAPLGDCAWIVRHLSHLSQLSSCLHGARSRWFKYIQIMSDILWPFLPFPLPIGSMYGIYANIM